MYIHGGRQEGSTVNLSDMWKFNLFTYTWSQVFSFDNATYFPLSHLVQNLSLVVVGCADTYLPGTHTVIAVHTY